MKVIEVENAYHMGDQIINFIYFHQIKDYLEQNDIFIKYYCLDQYHKNLHDFNPTKNISIHSLQEPYGKKYYELWQGGRIQRIIPRELSHCYNDVLCFMFNVFLKDFNMNITVNTFEYEYPKILEWYQAIDNKYKNTDILIINSHPRSGQYNYNKNSWDRQIIELSKKYKILTTEKVNNDILSLDSLDLKDICAISTNVKYIIAINTGPLIPLFNKYTLDNVKQLFIFGSGIFNSRNCLSANSLNADNILNCINN